MRKAWQLLAIAVAAISLGACGGNGGTNESAGGDELDKVTLDLSFLMDGNKAPFVLGREKGLFKEQGIDITLVEGTGSSDSVKFLANKRFDFALPGAQILAQAVDTGLPIKMVANHMPRDQLVIFVRDESPIRTLKDLEGRSLVAETGQQTSLFLEPVLKAAGVDIGKVKLEEVRAEVQDQLFLQGKYDAVAAPFEAIAVMQQAEKGLKLRAFPYADYGFGAMNQGLATHVDTIKDKPDLVRRMVAAYANSYLYASEHTQELIDVVSRLYPSATTEVLAAEWNIALALVATKNTEGKPFGHMAPEDWEKTLEALRKSGDVKKELPIETFYTNEFIGDWEHLPAQGEFAEVLGGGA